MDCSRATAESKRELNSSLAILRDSVSGPLRKELAGSNREQGESVGLTWNGESELFVGLENRARSECPGRTGDLGERFAFFDVVERVPDDASIGNIESENRHGIEAEAGGN